MVTDTLKLSPKQQKVIERALVSADKMREFIATRSDAKLYQLAALFRRMVEELEATIQNQCQEIRCNGLPQNWTNEEKQRFLR